MNRKWDNKNVMDYAVRTAREEERAKADQEKKDLAQQMLLEKEPLDKIVRYTKLSIEEIEALYP